MDAYSPANTIKDRNGNLKVSGSSNELSDYPVGAPIPWPQATAPAGFLVCNGQSFNKTTYPLLAKAYPTGILPDLRGEFLRGLDTGRGVDSGRAVLSAQGDAFRAHNHSVIGEDSGSGTAYFGRGNGSRRTISKDAMNLEGGTETRPRNIAFLYIVRAA
ncbi:tail fiber protein [Providencia rettgeri]|nr:tail fiber protein [Providencia rettgeri]